MAVKDIDQKTLYYIIEQLADYYISKESANYYVTTNTPQIISGQKTFSSSILASSTSVNVGYSTSKFGYGYFNNQVWIGTGSSGSGYTQYEDGAITKWGNYAYTKLTFPVATTSTGSYSIDLPAKSGTLAIATDVVQMTSVTLIKRFDSLGTGDFSLNWGTHKGYWVCLEITTGECDPYFIPGYAMRNIHTSNDMRIHANASHGGANRWWQFYYVNSTTVHVSGVTGITAVRVYGVN